MTNNNKTLQHPGFIGAPRNNLMETSLMIFKNLSKVYTIGSLYSIDVNIETGRVILNHLPVNKVLMNLEFTLESLNYICNSLGMTATLVEYFKTINTRNILKLTKELSKKYYSGDMYTVCFDEKTKMVNVLPFAPLGAIVLNKMDAEFIANSVRASLMENNKDSKIRTPNDVFDPRKHQTPWGTPQSNPNEHSQIQQPIFNMNNEFIGYFENNMGIGNRLNNEEEE